MEDYNVQKLKHANVPQESIYFSLYFDKNLDITFLNDYNICTTKTR